MSIEHPVIASAAAPAAPSRPRVPAWRFWLPMVCQLAIVAAVPAPQVWAHATGTTVFLRTAPVDPYDVLRGRYMRLGYADDSFESLKKLPGWQAEFTQAPRDLWVEFAAAAAPQQPWKAVALHAERPAGLPSGHVAIRGRTDGSSVSWGMTQYYIPESAGDGLEAAMRQAQSQVDGRNQSPAILVEARVDAGGMAVLEGLWISGRRY